MSDEKTTASELDRLSRAAARQESVIVELARPLIAVLKDAGRMHSAKALEEALFLHDALKEEMASVAGKDMQGFFEWMSRMKTR